jgi:glutathione peroxidase
MRHSVLVPAVLLGLLTGAPALAADCKGSPLNHEQKRLLGGPENLCDKYAGKVVLVVNTASHCGYTPQFTGIEKLYKKYKDQGLVVLGFPSDQFHQEEASDENIAKICSANYGVSFPMYTRTAVAGKDANPVYQDLIAATGEPPAWNFNKYLIGRDGKALAHYGSQVTPEDPALLAKIEAELAKAPKP